MAFGDTITAAVLGKVSVPEDTNNAPNVVAEGAAVNTTVGITAHSTFANGNAGLDYTLSADSSGGGFKIDHDTGVVTVADPSKIDFESAPLIGGVHAYSITVLATKNNNFSAEQTFIITVNDVAPSAPVDSNAAANTVLEGAANGTAVGITASSSDGNGGAVTYSLIGDTSGGGFTINATTGVVTVADGSKIDFESAPGHAYTVTVQSSDGTLTSSQAFTINVGDVPMTTPIDANGAANTVAEGAAAGTTVGVTAFASDPSGPATTYSLIGDTSGGGFTINATTGVVTVANPAKLDFESTPGHIHNVTVQATNGVQTVLQTYTIGITDVAPSAPTDSNGATNTVAEGAANGTVVGVTASSTDVNGPAPTYSLIGDTSGGGFTINATTGVITVADSTKINFETAPGHAYTVTAQSSDGTLTNSQTFTIAVTDVAPTAPVDNDGAINTVAEGAANGSTVGVMAFSTDVNGGAVTYSLTGDTSGGGFTVNSTTGVVTVADSTRLDYETGPAGHAYTVTVQASDGTLSNQQAFTIALTDVAPTAPVDVNGATNTVAEGAANGSTVGITASSVDPNGPATTYSLTDNAGGRFAIDSSTGIVTVANGAAIDFETAPGHAYGITVQATNGALTTSSAFSIGVTDVGPSTPADINGAADSVFELATNGTVVGITASSADPGGGPAPIYTLTDNAGGRFAIDGTTGIVTVANGAAIDFETAPGPGHSYDITVQSTAGALSSTHTFSIGVGDVNEAPAGTDKTVTMLEGDSYTFSVADFGFSDPSDSVNPNSLLAVKMTTVPGAGTGTFTNNGVTVNAGDSVSATDIALGHLVFTPTAHSNGAPEASFTFQVQDNGGALNGGVDLDQSANTVTINVNAVNDAPVNSVPGSQSVNEEATLTFSSGNGNAITISDVDVGSGNETVTLTVTNGTLALGSHAGLVSFSPDNAASITLTGTIANIDNALNGLTYTGNLNFNGTETLTVSTNDNGNTGAGGPQIDSDPITINVAPINDAPTATNLTQSLTINEDAAATTLFTLAPVVSDVDSTNVTATLTLAAAAGVLNGAGAGVLNAATLTYTITGTQAAVNSALAAVTYDSAQDFNGSASVGVTIDDGASGPQGTNPTGIVSITVNAVNDAPSFTVGGTQNALEDSGAHTVNGFITGISPGPADEAGQTVNFLVSNDNTGLFSVGPAIDASGNLTYTLAANANGSATVTVQLHDNGGTASGGSDTSAGQTFVINAGPVNDAPSGADNTLTTLEDTSHTFTAAEFGFTDLIDAGGASGANNLASVIITTVPAGAAGTLTDNGVTLVAGATVSKADIDAGLLKFNPAANANGNGEATFTFQVKDDGGTANLGVDTDQSPNTITLNVTSVNDAPAGTDTTIASVGAHTFAASEFGFTDLVDAGSAHGADTFQAVIITTLPDPLTGDLKLNGVAVNAGDSIAASDIGGLVFTPVGSNPATFTFQVQDNGGLANGGVDTDQSPNSFTIQQNAPPIIDSDGSGATAAVSVAENQTAVTTVHATDPDSQPSPISYSIVPGDDGAKFGIDAGGHLAFLTAPNFENPTDVGDTAGNNTYVVTVRASDGASFDDQTITVTVTNVNEAPTAVADTTLAVEAGGIANGTAGTNPTGNVIAGTTSSGTPSTPDSDPDAGDTLTVQGVAAGSTVAVLTTNVGSDVNGSFGKLNISSTGAYTYTVDNTNTTVQALRQTTDTLTDTFSYTIKDAAGLTSTTQVTVTIDGANDNPVANADAANVTEASGTTNGTPGTNITSGFNVLTGAGAGSVADTDVDTHGETQAVTGVETGTHLSDTVTTGANAPLTGLYGTLTLNTDGSYTYNVDNTNTTVEGLNTGSHVDDVFTYTMQDAAGAKSTTTLTIHVNGADDAPVATADSYVAFENRAFTANAATGVLANDTDVDTAHTSLTAVLDSGPSHAAAGGFTLNADGSFSYTAATGYLGGDSFTYHADDGPLNSATVTVSIDVQPLVWHIDNSHNPADLTQDGSTAHPFQSIAAFNAANAAAGVHPDIVYLHSGTGTYSTTDGINLNNGQTLLGQGVDLTYTTSASAPGGAHLVTLLDLDNSVTPTIQVTGGAGDAGVTLAQGNTLSGFNISTTNADGIGIEDSNAAGTAGSVGTLHIDTVGISGVGKAIDIDQGGTLSNVHFSSIASTGSNSEGIQLGGIAGSTLGGSFTVDGTTSITNADTTAIQVSNTAAGASFSFGTSTTVTDSAIGSGHNGNGIDFSTGIGTTNSFSLGNTSITTDGGFGLKAVSAGTLTFGGTNSINATGGAAVDLTSTALSNATFGTVSSSGGTVGINIVTPGTGAFTANGGTLSGHTANEINLSGGNTDFTYAGTINDGTGNSVTVANKTGGTTTISGSINDGADDNGGIGISGNSGGAIINFSGTTKTLNTGIGDGVSMASNTGATINFTNGGLNIDTTNGSGFIASGGGTINVTGTTNSINSTGSGTALNVANTTIGASNLNFHDISAGNNTAAADPVNGIILNNTGASGHLAVTGNGSVAQGGDASGGLIQNTTGAGISLTTTLSPTLNNMSIQSTAASGINGTDVTNFSFTNGTINNSGTAHGVDTSNIAFNSTPAGATNNVDGTVTITNNVLSNAFYHGVDIQNRAGTIDALTISNNAITSATAQANSQGSGIHVITFGTASSAASITKATIDSNNIANFPTGAGIAIEGGNSSTSGPGGTMGVPNNATNIVAITNNTIHGQNTASPIGSEGIVALVQGGNAGSRSQGNFNISGNNITDTLGQGIAVSDFGDATVNAKVDNNIVDTNNIGKNIGSNGIGIGTGVVGTDTAATPLMTVEAIGNTVTDYDGNGIRLVALDTNGTLNATVQNNILGRAAGGGFPSRIRVDSGNENNAGNNTINLDISGNTTTGASNVADAPGIGLRLGDGGAATNILRIEGLSPSPATDVQTENFVSTNNPGMFAGTLAGSYSPAKRTEVIHGTTFFATAGNVPQPQLALHGAGPGSSDVLTMDELTPILAIAVQHWADAGASAAQVAQLEHAAASIQISDIFASNAVAQTDVNGQITIDANAAGWGWFVDSTPADNNEFHATGTANELAASSGDAAGHMDLLTAVEHELGHIIGLDDSNATGVMNANLDVGERRIVDPSDVAHANAGSATDAEAALPVSAQAAAGTPIIVGTAGNDTIDAGHGGNILFGGAGADHFVFGPSIQLNAPTPAQITHVADYHAAEGDTFDFSALTSQFHNSSVSDALVVQAVEDASGKFATLQVDTTAMGLFPGAPHWVNVAQIDGAHSGDAVNVLIDNHSVHLAQIHVDLLV